MHIKLPCGWCGKTGASNVNGNRGCAPAFKHQILARLNLCYLQVLS